MSWLKHLARFLQDVFCDGRGQQEDALGGLRKWMSKGRERRSDGMEVEQGIKQQVL